MNKQLGIHRSPHMNFSYDLSKSVDNPGTNVNKINYGNGINSAMPKYNNYSIGKNDMFVRWRYDESKGVSCMEMNARSSNLKKLFEMSKLEEDWNGYSAKKISNRIIELAKSILDIVEQQPEIYPTGRGTINMQYELKDKSYLEFELFDNRIECLKVPKREYSKAVTESINEENIVRVSKILKEFCANND